LGTYPIEPQSEQATVYVLNNYKISYGGVKANFRSVFFDFDREFSLGPLEKKEFVVSLGDLTSSLGAGKYIMSTNLSINDANEVIESNIIFSEKALIKSEEESFGLAVRKDIITKTNEGNLETMAEVVIKKNIISRLFTTFSVQPYKVNREGGSVYYYWQKELRPSESFTVRVTTNWLIPLLVILGAIVLGFFISLYRKTHLLVRKRVSFVRSKGGEFALKVSLHVRAKANVEKIKIFDRLPPIAKLYERYGAVAPDKFDKTNRRLEWNLGSMDVGEERVLSYIIYSKVGVIGRLELPRATAVYEHNSNITESQSNRTYVVTEPKNHHEF